MSANDKHVSHAPDATCGNTLDCRRLCNWLGQFSIRQIGPYPLHCGSWPQRRRLAWSIRRLTETAALTYNELAMSTLDDAEKIGSSVSWLLSRAEKAAVGRQSVVRDLMPHTGIEASPNVCGGEPCIVRTRIPVWTLEQSRRLGITEADLLRSYPTLRAEDLANAWAFVRLHREDIESQIAENEAA